MLWSDLMGCTCTKGFEPCSEDVPCPSPSVIRERHGKIRQDSHGSKMVVGARRRQLKQLLLYLTCNGEPGFETALYVPLGVAKLELDFTEDLVVPWPCSSS